MRKQTHVSNENIRIRRRKKIFEFLELKGIKRYPVFLSIDWIWPLENLSKFFLNNSWDFYNSFIMLYTEYFTLQDCSRILQIRSQIRIIYVSISL